MNFGSNMKRTLANLLPNPIIECIFRIQAAGIHLENFSQRPPILIYQMGKVGSSSVYNSVKNAGSSGGVYQIHFLNKENLEQISKTYFDQSTTLTPKHIFFSRVLQKKIASHPEAAWKIITIVRDPIGRVISDFFENPGIHARNLVGIDGRIDIDGAKAYLQKRFADFRESEDYVCNWFDREMKPTFGIDVFAYDFPHSDGYQIITENTISLLILRMEDLSRTFETAIMQFLHLPKAVSLSKANVGDTKEYATQYKGIQKTILLPENVCRRIYDTKYAKHFYDQTTREQFTEKWSTNRSNTSI